MTALLRPDEDLRIVEWVTQLPEPDTAARTTCAVCGEPLPGRRTVVCSEECRRQRLYSSEAFVRATQKYKQKRIAAGMPNIRSKSRKCRRCGNGWVRRGADYCSRECFQADHPARPKPVPPPKPPRPIRDGPSWRIFIRNCVICDTLFTTPYTRVTCSAECARQKYRSDQGRVRMRRRARLIEAYVESVEPWEVFVRDGWICGLCGEDIDPDLVAPDLECASVDHIIPLARGGTHEMANVQAAHLICNSRKGARVEGEIP